MSARLAGGAIGVVFGLTLCWSGMADPNVIRDALLLRDGYLFAMFALAVATAAIGLRVLAATRTRSLLGAVPLSVPRERVERRHVAGSLLFGAGWGVACACPGPMLAQVGAGTPWGVVTLAGALGGVALYQRRGARETELADDAPIVEPGRGPAIAAARG